MMTIVAPARNGSIPWARLFLAAVLVLSLLGAAPAHATMAGDVMTLAAGNQHDHPGQPSTDDGLSSAHHANVGACAMCTPLPSGHTITLSSKPTVWFRHDLSEKGHDVSPPGRPPRYVV
jgi:hypothetical protein